MAAIQALQLQVEAVHRELQSRYPEGGNEMQYEDDNIVIASTSVTRRNAEGSGSNKYAINRGCQRGHILPTEAGPREGAKIQRFQWKKKDAMKRSQSAALLKRRSVPVGTTKTSEGPALLTAIPQHMLAKRREVVMSCEPIGNRVNDEGTRKLKSTALNMQHSIAHAVELKSSIKVNEACTRPQSPSLNEVLNIATHLSVKATETILVGFEDCKLQRDGGNMVSELGNLVVPSPLFTAGPRSLKVNTVFAPENDDIGDECKNGEDNVTHRKLSVGVCGDISAGPACPLGSDHAFASSLPSLTITIPEHPPSTPFSPNFGHSLSKIAAEQCMVSSILTATIDKPTFDNAAVIQSTSQQGEDTVPEATKDITNIAIDGVSKDAGKRNWVCTIPTLVCKTGADMKAEDSRSSCGEALESKTPRHSQIEGFRGGISFNVQPLKKSCSLKILWIEHDRESSPNSQRTVREDQKRYSWSICAPKDCLRKDCPPADSVDLDYSTIYTCEDFLFSCMWSSQHASPLTAIGAQLKQMCVFMLRYSTLLHDKADAFDAEARFIAGKNRISSISRKQMQDARKNDSCIQARAKYSRSSPFSSVHRTNSVSSSYFASEQNLGGTNNGPSICKCTGITRDEEDASSDCQGDDIDRASRKVALASFTCHKCKHSRRPGHGHRQLCTPRPCGTYGCTNMYVI